MKRRRPQRTLFAEKKLETQEEEEEEEEDLEPTQII